jgi:hypothetical protein
MASSAKELKEKLRKRSLPITVTIPGTDLTIECRRPDLVHMVMSGLMTWPALERVRAMGPSEPVDGIAVIDNRPLPTIVDRAQAVGSMLDEWVCLAAVSPRVVMREHEVGDDSIWVEDLPFQGRQAIFDATFLATPTAGADFRGDESGSAPPGQSGEAVRDAPIDPSGHDGPDGGAGS